MLAPPRIRRRAFLGSTLAAFGLGAPALAAEPEVPIPLQIDLLNRVLPFDRALPRLVGTTLRVAVLSEPHVAESTRVSNRVLAELRGRPRLGGYPTQAALVEASEAPAAVDACVRLGAAVVYVCPGVHLTPEALALALHGRASLTVAALPGDVSRGLVLGFRLRSSKPRLLVNLTRARAQHIDFRADFLRMVEVVG